MPMEMSLRLGLTQMAVSPISLRPGDLFYAHVCGLEAPVPSTAIVYLPVPNQFALAGDVTLSTGGIHAVCHRFLYHQINPSLRKGVAIFFVDVDLHRRFLNTSNDI